MCWYEYFTLHKFWVRTTFAWYWKLEKWKLSQQQHNDRNTELDEHSTLHIEDEFKYQCSESLNQLKIIKKWQGDMTEFQVTYCYTLTQAYKIIKKCI